MYAMLGPSAKYGFAMRAPCGSFDWKPDQDFVIPIYDDRLGLRSSARWIEARRWRSPSPSPVWLRGSPTASDSGGVGPVFVGDGSQELIWPSASDRTGAIALLGSVQVAELSERRVPRGATAGAVSIAWSRHVASLRDTLTRSNGLPLAEAADQLAKAVSAKTQSRSTREMFFRKFDRAPAEAVSRPDVLVLDVNAILGVHRPREVTPDEEGEEEGGGRDRDDSI